MRVLLAQDLHITSMKFDDPPAVALVEKSSVAISVHGEKGSVTQEACVGGARLELGARVAKSLRQAGFAAEHPCQRFPAIDPPNIVNRASAGVQLELTRALRDALDADSQRMDRFTGAVKDGVTQFLQLLDEEASRPRSTKQP